ncbi:acetylornithine deacetylase/succinyl-diaminopimelate desuccinylase family protein [Breoghania corrubedonensis]|uniref:Probable succinyl-diaminopimelate desuccinylase n=1 Tax=Breoghania corrubedonensis TaxID=665038 RepID=A0A2T5V8R8_9HYPH|nr:ArgE/DapE family deacylase [Breoghania corrubedonensis]PTW60140.1 acetylornithine deacetylase/succinyl-diaminopimelate desuccinylase family protein [Breoghania corrubedonensis]
MKAAIEARWAEEVEFLKELVKVPSDNPPGDCEAHAERTAELLQELGFKVEQHPVPEPFVRQNGMRSVTNLIVRQVFGAGTGPTIALNAHGDVVPPGDGWTTDPYGAEEHNGAVYGRGVAVSKSDFATYAFALLALIAEPDGLNGAVELHFTYDEEAGGFVGPKWLLGQELTKPDYAISAGFSYAITTAHNGCLHVEVLVRGRQAHAGMPETGADALEASVPILAALYDERHRLAGVHSAQKGIDTPKLTIGLINGGINTNVVPDRITFRVDRRLIPEENGAAVEEGLRELIMAAAPSTDGIEVECRRIMLAEPLRPGDGTDVLVKAIAIPAEAILGEPIGVTGIPLYTDARHYAEAGIPTVLYGAGPRSILKANAHGADEHLYLGDLKAATEIVALALKDLLSE